LAEVDLYVDVALMYSVLLVVVLIVLAVIVPRLISL
jgi:hypothetical protein